MTNYKFTYTTNVKNIHVSLRAQNAHLYIITKIAILFYVIQVYVMNVLDLTMF